MNYDGFLAKCNEQDISPSDLLEKIGVSSGNLGSWKKNGNPSPAVLKQLSTELKCSTDFLLGIEETSITPKNVFDSTFKTFQAMPQRIASLKRGKEITNIAQLEDYLNCEQGFLFITEIIHYEPANPNKKAIYDPAVEFMVMDILDRCADSVQYKALQIQISRIILYWLKRKDAQKFDELFSCKQISIAKLIYLRDGKPSRISSDNYGLNLSDVFYIANYFGVLPSYVFNGYEKK